MSKKTLLVPLALALLIVAALPKHARDVLSLPIANPGYVADHYPSVGAATYGYPAVEKEGESRLTFILLSAGLFAATAYLGWTATDWARRAPSRWLWLAGGLAAAGLLWLALKLLAPWMGLTAGQIFGWYLRLGSLL